MEQRMEAPLLGVSHDDSDREDSVAEHSTIGYRTTTGKASLYLLLCVGTVGIFYLLARWILRLRVWVLYVECEMATAQYVLRVESDPNVGEAGTYLEAVVTTPSTRFYLHKGLRFVYDEGRGDFINHEYRVQGLTCDAVRNLIAQSNAASREAQIDLFGANAMHVPVPSIPELLVDELLHPFYVFQVFSVVIWLLQFYWIYASAIFILATAGLVFSIRQTRSNNLNLQRMAKQQAQVTVVRGDRKLVLDSMDLIPGDVISLEDQTNHNLVCDVILLRGECVVNESSLTGESVPVIKTEIPSDLTPFRYNLHARHILFCGTNLRRVRDFPLGVVVRTGYQTAKGEMIRQILYPKTQVFRFYQDALVFLAALFVVTIAGFIWSIVKFVSAGAPALTVTVRVLDLFTIVIPPALPIAMTAGTSFAVARLKKKGIFCIVPKSVNIAGRVNVMCFDKTGTLTHDHMDVFCVRGVVAGIERARFEEQECKRVSDVKTMPLLWTLAACHSVVKLSAMEIVGDPLEVKMMQFTGWTPSGFDQSTESERASVITRKSMMHSPTSIEGKQDIETLVRHEFSSMLARMSVVIRAPDGVLWVLTKGSPEQIEKMCIPNSIPGNFNEILSSYTAQGMRTIGLAGRPLDDISVSTERDLVECNLTFFGLLVMVNPLKPESEPLVRELQEAQVRVVMITGDHALTAVQVARKCEIVRRDRTSCLVDCEPHSLHLSVTFVKKKSQERVVQADWGKVMGYTSGEMDIILTGNAYDSLMQESADRQHILLHETKVFARTSPIQKTSIVSSLKRGGIDTVGMCGDGANDCGALKTADAGISISEGEAAIAAPFTAGSVDAVKHLLLEGRCALATSFTLFKFMILYSVIQFVGVIICYAFLNLFSDLQFLWVDLFLILPLSFTMGLTGPVSNLSSSRPPATLFRVSVITSILGHIAFFSAAYAGVVVWGRAQPWWNSPETLLNGWTQTGTQLVTIVFLFGNFIYLFVAVAFSIGHPFRRPFWYNWVFTLLVAIILAFNIGWFWTSDPGVQAFWSLAPIPVSFMGPLFGVVCGLGVTLYLWEVFVIRVLQPRDIRMQ